MRYGIIGTGAIGGYYGAKLAHAGQEVHFLLRSDYEYVKQHGLQVDSCDGSFHLADINAYQYTEHMPPCDVVLVCLKSVNNGKLQSLLLPLLHAQTLVVLIQNGIGVLRMSLSGMMEMKKNNYYCIQTDKQIHFFYGRQYQIRRFP